MRTQLLKRSAAFPQRWYVYFFKFIIIFSSIFLTFELDDYGEYLNEREKEDIYLLSLYNDFEKDINQLDRRIEKQAEKLAQLTKMTSYLNQYEKYRDSIQLFYHNCLNYTFLYNPVNSTFESLKSSGDIKLISNENIKILLSELDKQYSTTLHAGASITNLTEGNVWTDFFVSSIDTKTFNKLSDNPDLVPKFQSLLTLYIKYSSSYFFVLQGTLEKTKEAKEVLQDELHQRDILIELGKYNVELQIENR
jgi:hypothetical protein